MKQLILIFSSVILLLSCNQPSKEAAALQLQHTKDSLTQVIAQQKTIDSMKTINDSIKAVKHTEAVVNNGQSGQTNTQSTGSPSDAPKKKGWSNKAKGAVIGAGVGAVTGAIVDRRHRGVGAVIGGVGGAGAGYGVGAILDNKKKKENQ